MKDIFFILFILWTATALGQTKGTKKIKIEKEKETRKEKEKEKVKYQKTFLSVDLAYGEKIFGKTISDQFKSIDTLGLNWPIKFISTGFTGYRMPVNPRGDLYVKMLLNFIYPQNTKTDSVHNIMQGFIYNFGLGSDFRQTSRVFRIILYVGFNTGVLKLTSKESGTQFNPFFSPAISLQPKAVIGPIAISIILNLD